MYEYESNDAKLEMQLPNRWKEWLRQKSCKSRGAVSISQLVRLAVGKQYGLLKIEDDTDDTTEKGE